MNNYYKIEMKNILLAITILLLSSCKDEKKVNYLSEGNPIDELPNIVIIYLDDLGYGDLSTYGASEILTPNIDTLADGGVRFTNGYATSATCTPSRYGLLTGIYPWKNKNAKILPGTAPLIIDTEQVTIPKILKSKGYHTGVVGKWHLGLGKGEVDWNKKITHGPNEVGFDYSFIMAATQDRVPTVYIEDGNVFNLDVKDPIEVNYKMNFQGEPTGKENPELLRMKWHHGHNNSIINGIPRIGFMKGGESAKWVDEEMTDTFLERAKSFVSEKKDQPFFLYYAMQQPHVPRTPHPKFIGSSGLGPRGDVIVEADWAVGEFIQTLKDEGLLEKTLIILSSDNGPVLNDGYFDDALEKLGNHDPNGGLRGGKYSLYEAGTRVPFITYWKGTIQPKVSSAMVSQLDILESLASLTNVKVESTDGQNLLNTFLGKTERGRDNFVLEATSRTAYREADWVLIPPYQGPSIEEKVNIELGNSDGYMLFDLAKDPTQQQNLATLEPEKLQLMIKNFEAIRGTDYNDIQLLELK
jgi:arylsulfatase A-like enzyme